MSGAKPSTFDTIVGAFVGGLLGCGGERKSCDDDAVACGEVKPGRRLDQALDACKLRRFDRARVDEDRDCGLDDLSWCLLHRL